MLECACFEANLAQGMAEYDWHSCGVSGAILYYLAKAKVCKEFVAAALYGPVRFYSALRVYFHIRDMRNWYPL